MNFMSRAGYQMLGYRFLNELCRRGYFIHLPNGLPNGRARYANGMAAGAGDGDSKPTTFMTVKAVRGVGVCYADVNMVPLWEIRRSGTIRYSFSDSQLLTGLI